MMLLPSHDMRLHIHAIPVLTTFDAPPGYSIVRVLGPCREISAFTELAAESR